MVGPSACYINDRNYFGGFEKREIEDLLELMENDYSAWANVFAPAVMKNSDRPELSAELEESFCRTDPAITHQFAKVTFLSDNRADLPQLKTPSLILQCTDDVIAPLQVGEYLQKNMPHNTFKVLNAIGHCPHLSAPDETIAAMKEFLIV
jgi:sigma-B regulation protein RsbQ